MWLHPVQLCKYIPPQSYPSTKEVITGIVPELSSCNTVRHQW